MPDYGHISRLLAELFFTLSLVIGIFLSLFAYELLFNENYLVLPIVLILGYLEYYCLVVTYDGWQKRKNSA
jgi:hypothetical protein